MGNDDGGDDDDDDDDVSNRLQQVIRALKYN